MENLIIGSHVSFKKDGQLLGSVEEALSYGANALMLYTGAPQNTARSTINIEYNTKAFELMKANNIDISNVVVHAPYIINPANHNNFDFNVSFLKQEIRRVSELGLKKLILHPGSHVGVGIEEGIENIIEVLNAAINPDCDILICLEVMAGKGSEIGRNFDEIAKIISGIVYKEKVMVCLDTCHLNDSGYDVSDFDSVLAEFDRIIGLDKLSCVHINDSKNTRASSKDRHENIGFGEIGFDNLINIIYHPKLKDVPKILETPYVGLNNESKDRLYPPYKFEIEMIRNKSFDADLLNVIREYYK